MISAPDPRSDHFAILGVERRFDLDAADLERRYKDLARQHHPDRFAQAAPAERKAALEWTVRLNEAWRTLKEPVRRAEYVLELLGVAIATEEGSKKSGEKVAVPQALLGEILELRSELGEARLDGDDDKVRRMGLDMEARVERSLAAVRAALVAEPPELDLAARELVALRYFRRFLDEVRRHREEREGP